jgi:hypothetical protein
MITISPLDLLLLILAILAIPIGVLFSMILWRVYRMLDRVEKLLDMGMKIVDLIQNIDKIPMMILNKFLGK